MLPQVRVRAACLLLSRLLLRCSPPRTVSVAAGLTLCLTLAMLCTLTCRSVGQPASQPAGQLVGRAAHYERQRSLTPSLPPVLFL